MGYGYFVVKTVLPFLAKKWLHGRPEEKKLHYFSSKLGGYLPFGPFRIFMVREKLGVVIFSTIRHFLSVLAPTAVFTTK